MKRKRSSGANKRRICNNSHNINNELYLSLWAFHLISTVNTEAGWQWAEWSTGQGVRSGRTWTSPSLRQRPIPRWKLGVSWSMLSCGRLILIYSRWSRTSSRYQVLFWTPQWMKATISCAVRVLLARWGWWRSEFWDRQWMSTTRTRAAQSMGEYCGWILKIFLISPDFSVSFSN